MRKSRVNIKKEIKSNIKKIIETPIENFKDISRLEMMGNNEALLEGCSGILEYDENIIRISTKKNEIKFFGRGLNLKCLTPENVIIQGTILSVEFII